MCRTLVLIKALLRSFIMDSVSARYHAAHSRQSAVPAWHWVLYAVGPTSPAQAAQHSGCCSRRNRGGRANEKVGESGDEQLAECSFCSLFTSPPPDAKCHAMWGILPEPRHFQSFPRSEGTLIHASFFFRAQACVS